MGKEIDRGLETSELQAIKEVESYIEKIEKSAETAVSDNNTSQQSDTSSKSNPTIQQSNSMGYTDTTVKKVLLPIDQSEISSGLNAGVSSGIRWLSEWCVMMIKKYPGRVFYSSPVVEKYE